MRTSKKSYLIISALTLLVVLSVGYAMFFDVINIHGKAEAKGTFNTDFISASILKEVGSNGATAELFDRNTIKVNIPKLEYPGAYVDVNFKVKNKGTIETLLFSKEISGIESGNAVGTKALKVKINVNKNFYAPNDEGSGTFRIYWDENINVNEEINNTLALKLNYIQVYDKADACNIVTSNLDRLNQIVNDPSTATNDDLKLDLDLSGDYTSNDVTLENNIKTEVCN